MSVISDGTDKKHKILERSVIDDLTRRAEKEIEDEQMDLSWDLIDFYKFLVKI